MEHEHLADVPESDMHSLSPEEAQASFMAAYELGRWLHSQSIQPEIDAATASRDVAIAAGEPAESIARHERTVRYWQHVKLEMTDVYRNSHSVVDNPVAIETSKPPHEIDDTTEYSLINFKIDELREANLAWCMFTKNGTINRDTPQARFFADRAAELSRELFHTERQRKSVGMQLGALVRRLFGQ